MEVNLYFDEIRQIVTKFSTKMLKEKGEGKFGEINEGPIKTKLIDLILNVVANKGDKLAVSTLRKSLTI